MKLLTSFTFFIFSVLCFAGAKFCYNPSSKNILITNTVFYYGTDTTMVPIIQKSIQNAWDSHLGYILWNNQNYQIQIISKHFIITPKEAQKKALITTTPDFNFIKIASTSVEESSYVEADYNGIINNLGVWLSTEVAGYWNADLREFIYLPARDTFSVLQNSPQFKDTKVMAHEFGHLLGLEHPNRGNLFEMGAPQMMAPRGIYVDAPYQLDPSIDPMVDSKNPGAKMDQTLRVVSSINYEELFSKVKYFAEHEISACRYIGGVKQTLLEN